MTRPVTAPVDAGDFVRVVDNASLAGLWKSCVPRRSARFGTSVQVILRAEKKGGDADPLQVIARKRWADRRVVPNSFLPAH